MERFKVLEKEMKIKAFSKEGLNQATKLDPKAKEKLDLSTWINGVVDKLNTQIDAYEAESETMSLNLKKGKKLETAKQTRQDLLQKSTERHKDHIHKLEAILRLMENDQVSTEQVSALRDEVDYYIDAHLEEDYVDNEAMYEDFDFSNTPESDSDSYSDESDHEHGTLFSQCTQANRF
jgi:CCR4-NOT transcription complex subunit 3